MAAIDKADLLQGTLSLLILRVLRVGPLHGWGVSKRIRMISSDVLQIQQGSLYPALYRLEERGLIRAAWKETDTGRLAKVYSLTADGRAHLTEQRATWERFAGAIAAILKRA